MSTSVQEQALLDLIDADCRRRCEEIRDSARRQSADLLREAHLHARQRLRRVLNDARDRARQRVAAALAQRQTRERLAQQNCASEILKQALQRLPAALTQRWQQAGSRSRWVAMALSQANRCLPAGPWRIEHAEGMRVEDLTGTGTGASHHLQLDPRLVAGLRIFGNGNCVDASLSGLLSDRDNLAAALLQAWEAGP